MQTGDIDSAAPGRGTFTESDFEKISGFEAYDRADSDIGTVQAIWTDQGGAPAYLGEVPVVSKEARVKEEVRARKTKKAKKEVVSDKIRREDIDVEEESRPPYH